MSLYCCDGFTGEIRGKARGVSLYQCLPAQPRHLLRIGKLLPRPAAPLTSPKKVHTTRLACPRLHHLHRFPACQHYSSLQAACLRTNRSHKTQYRSSLNLQAYQRLPSRVLRPRSLLVALAPHRYLSLQPRRSRPKAHQVRTFRHLR